jgi:shikimate dehydrogenase
MAKAVAAALCYAGFQKGFIVVRNKKEGAALAAQHGFEWRPELTGENPGLLINITPIGRQGTAEAELLAFSEEKVCAAAFVFDVVAIPVETLLIRLAGR